MSITDEKEKYSQVDSEYFGDSVFDGVIVNDKDGKEKIAVLFLKDSLLSTTMNINKLKFSRLMIVGLVPNTKYSINYVDNAISISNNVNGNVITSSQGIIDIKLESLSPVVPLPPVNPPKPVKLEILKFDMTPNPFDPNKQVLKIDYTISKKAKVQVSIYSSKKQVVFSSSIDDSKLSNSIEWNGHNLNDRVANIGNYTVYLKVSNGLNSVTKKLLVKVSRISK